MKRILLLSQLAIFLLGAQEYTRGVGVYPGDPKEDFSPVLVANPSAAHNLALHRPAYHSSSYDFNLTAQLVTDGIKTTTLPQWISAATSDNPTPKKNEREYFVDHHTGYGATLRGSKVWVQLGLLGGDGAPEVDRIDVSARVQPNAQQAAGWTCTVEGSDDGQVWTELGRAAGAERPNRDFQVSLAFSAAARRRFYRVNLEAPSVPNWRVNELAFFDKKERVQIGGPYHFTSAWMSEGAGEQWVYVDLGEPCTFDRVVLSWIRRAQEGVIQTSDNAAAWTTIQALPSATGTTDDLKLAHPAKARYVRVLMTRAASPDGYILSELEVYGRGGMMPRAKPAQTPQADGRLNLAGGGWRLERDSLVTQGGEALSKVGYPDKDWIVATVPATILSSYVNDGALPDPNYGDNQRMISDSFFWADFWYRDEFLAPPAGKDKRTWLNFDGINWKADVFLNGAKVGRIDGAFMRGRFDVTNQIHPGVRNAIAVRIIKNATPGSVKDKGLSFAGSGGALGSDDPTYHASIGWDWISTIRGRDNGIWADVYLTQSGGVTIENPLVTTTLPLPETSHADVTIEASLHNQDSRPVTGTLRGRFGVILFEMPVTLDASASKTVKLDPGNTPVLRLANPKLWWPNGYGEPNLYSVELKFETAAKVVSDQKSFQAGVRQFTYSEEGGLLKMWINGRRFIPRGGNWGFPESMLRYRAREYDAAVRYHRDEHFTMIRNWVGQTGDEAFYDACDRYGIVVWQDFWLANPVDGPDPDDNALFLRNARDYVQRIRNHASVGLYCGRNEGFPPKAIDQGLRAMLPELHPGLHYISSSADEVVSGHGPYRNQTLRAYFTNPPTKLHSEMGSANILTLDSLRQMLPADLQWPPNNVMTLHDGFSRGATIEGYGTAKSAAEWSTLAQFQNYDAHRGMFEGQSKTRLGLLIWMSHSAWPSLLWQTYDYYFDPDAGYFGAKKGAEPLHIQWNAAADTVEIVNYSAGEARGLSAHAEILNMDGALQWEKTAALDSQEDTTVSPIQLQYPANLTTVHFIRLTLKRGADVVSTNFYLRGTKENDYHAIGDLPKVNLEAATRVERQGNRWVLTTELRNVSAQPALMAHIKAVREKSGDRILPALYSDNYVALMPGERKTIHTELNHADTRGERPRIVVEGFNVGDVTER